MFWTQLKKMLGIFKSVNSSLSLKTKLKDTNWNNLNKIKILQLLAKQQIDSELTTNIKFKKITC